MNRIKKMLYRHDVDWLKTRIGLLEGQLDTYKHNLAVREAQLADS